MGAITANNGYVAMMGKHVANEGTIVATMGNVQLASGEKISLNLNGNSLVKLTIDQGTLNALVENKGLIKADGGQVYLTAQALNTILDGMVNNTGVIEASSLTSVGGKIALLGDVVVNSGSLLATGKTGGGEILVGGAAHGSNADIYGEAKYTILTADSIIDASATDNGNGGKIAVWSNLIDGLTVANGSIKAEGGANGGDGGFIETSGHILDIKNGIEVNAKAPKGKNGSWLLDPVDIEIFHADTSDLSIEGSDTFDAQDSQVNDTGYWQGPDTDVDCGGSDVCDPQRLYTAHLNQTSRISDYSINAALDSGTSVFISTYKNGSTGNGDITVSSGVNIKNTSGGMDSYDQYLVFGLFADRNIIINGATISAGDIVNPLSVVLMSNMGSISELSTTTDQWGDYPQLTRATFPSLASYNFNNNSGIRDALLNPGSGGYIEITDSAIYTYGGGFMAGGNGYTAPWGGYAVSNDSHAGVLISNSVIRTGGVGLNEGGTIMINGANTSTGDGIKIENSDINSAKFTSNSNFNVADTKGTIYLSGISSGGNGVYLTKGIGARSYMDGGQILIDGASTAAYNTGKAAVNIEYTNMDSTEETWLSGYNFLDIPFYGRSLSYFGDSRDPQVYQNLGTSGTLGILIGKSAKFNSALEQDLYLYMSSFASYGVKFAGDTTDYVQLGNSNLNNYMNLQIGFYGAQGARMGGISFADSSSDSLRMYSNGGQGDLLVWDSTGNYAWNNDYGYGYYPQTLSPFYIGGTTAPTSGGFISDDALTRLLDPSTFKYAYFGNSGEGDVVVRNFNPSDIVGEIAIEGINVTLANGATIKTPTGGHILFATDGDTGTFTNSGATFTGSGDYFVYVYDNSKIVGTAPARRLPGYSGGIDDYDIYHYGVYDADENLFDYSGGSAVLCSAEACGSGGGSGGSTPVPTPTTNVVVQNQVNNVVTTVVNSTTVTPPLPVVATPLVPQPSLAQSQTTQLLQTIMPQGNTGEHFNLVGTTDGVTPVQTVSMEQLQSASGGQGINEIRVPLGQDSFVDLINGGVNLPLGLSQEFYVINNTNSEKKN